VDWEKVKGRIRRGTRRAGAHEPGAVETGRPWPALRPIDFEGEDTSLTQEEIGLLK